MVRSVSRLHRSVTGVALAALLTGFAATGAVAIDAADSPNPLDHPRIDAALLAGDPPRLLVVDPRSSATDTGATREAPVDLAVLEAGPGGGWATVERAAIELAADIPATDEPWLIGLGGDRFALIVASEAAGRSEVVGLRVGPAAEGSPLTESWRRPIDGLVDDAGLADVEGDGRADLVLASARTERGGDICQGSRMWVADPSDGAIRTYEVQGLRFASGVIGRFDDVAGDDLAAYAYPNCPAGPDEVAELRLVAVRLVDGSRITEGRGVGTLPLRWLGPPVRLDAEADGRHELLALIPRGLGIVDPRGGWSERRVATSAAIPLGAVAIPRSADGGEALSRVVWLEPSVEGRGSIGTEIVRREVDGSIDTGPATVMWDPEAPSDRWLATVGTTIATVGAGGPPIGMPAAPGPADCRGLIVPLAVIPCDRAGLAPGAAWIGTRPLAIVTVAGRDLTMVAAGIERADAVGLPLVPAPWATGGPPGWWRHGPSAPFVLATLPLDTMVAEPPVPAPVVDREVAVGAVAVLGTREGTRLLVDSMAVEPDAVAPEPRPGVASLLGRERDAGRAASIDRAPVAPGLVSGQRRAVRSVELPTAIVVEGAKVASWEVAVAALDDRGELVGPVAAQVRLDLEPPALAIEVPDLTPIWPVAARITGTVEPGSTVEVGGRPVGVEIDGSFAFETTLAPWPQTVRVVARDPYGNRTESLTTVVGGVDYRGFPWSAIIATLVVVAAVVSGLLGVRRRQVSAGSPAPGGPWPSDEARPELEELAPGEGLVRDP